MFGVDKLVLEITSGGGSGGDMGDKNSKNSSVQAKS